MLSCTYYTYIEKLTHTFSDYYREISKSVQEGLILE